MKTVIGMFFLFGAVKLVMSRLHGGRRFKVRLAIQSLPEIRSNRKQHASIHCDKTYRNRWPMVLGNVTIIRSGTSPSTLSLDGPDRSGCERNDHRAIALVRWG